MEELSWAKSARDIPECWSQHGVSPLCIFPLPAKVPLKHWFSTCGSWPSHRGRLSDVYVAIPNRRRITIYSIIKMILWLGVTTSQGMVLGIALARLRTTSKEIALQHSQPHVSLHRHSEDTLATIIIILTITRLYAEYLKKKKSNFE